MQNRRIQISVMFQENLSQLVDIENSIAIFVMATYGEGEPTDNAKDFYDWLQQQDSVTELNGVLYAVCCALYFEQTYKTSQYTILTVGLILLTDCIL